jgi:PhnB protein
MEVSMEMNAYLSFKGECEAAFRFYEQCLGGTLGPVFRYAGTPLADQVPADWQDKVMHASLTVGSHVLMGGDVAPERYEEPKGFSLSLQLDDTADAERMFRDLSTGGRIVTPLEKTFWTTRFGVVIDRFGITWLINCDGSEDSSEQNAYRAQPERAG